MMMFKNIKIIWAAIVALLLGLENGNAQDPQFSQYYATPLTLAPSFAGAAPENSRVSALYRNQWPSVKGFNTYSVSFDYFIPKINSGLGLLFMQDVAGDGNYGIMNGGLQYSFDFKITDQIHIRPGAHFYFVRTSLDFASLTFYDEVLSGTEGTSVTPTTESNLDMDFALSTLIYNKHVWGGITIDHLLGANQSLYGGVLEAPMKIAVFGGLKYLTKERLIRKFEESVTFSFLYTAQGGYNQLNLGAYYYKYPLMFGLWYRGLPVLTTYHNSDALAFMAGYKIDNFTIGYSYDYTVSKLVNYSGGAHEISLTYSFKIKRWTKKPEAIPCPHF
jgi:type IX secretion system PorP/SprF family membrane protein